MVEKRVYAFRGAICTENTQADIINNTKSLYETLVSKNNLSEFDMISIQFTTTPDLTAINPAKALRLSGYADSTPLFCAQEPVFEESLKKVIRIMIHAYSDKKPESVYLNGAQALRPDLTND